MIKSMTGYGRGESAGRFGTLKVEIKGLNNKFFDLNSRLPEGLAVFEDRVREYTRKKVKRGRLNLSITYTHAAKKEKRVTVDRKLASFLLSEIRGFQKAEGLKGEIRVSDIISLPGILNCDDTPKDVDKMWLGLKKALDRALRSLDASRVGEGRRLAKDMLFRIKKIAKHISAISKRSSASLKHYKREFSRRIKELSGGVAIDKARLAQEVAIYAKNCDITEEITRLKSHIVGFEGAIASGGEKGKILDFMAQELMREANTIGAKSGDFSISTHIIKVKGEIEKIREQARNIE